MMSVISEIFAEEAEISSIDFCSELSSRWLSLTTRRNTPALALIIPGTIGFILATTVRDGGLLIDIAVFGATVSYVLLNLSHIVLRIREPELDRGYWTPGGRVTTSIALVLAVVSVVATFLVDVMAASYTLGVFVLALAYFWFYSRHRVVTSAPEAEFASIAEAASKPK